MSLLSSDNVQSEFESWRSLPSADQVYGWLKLQSNLKAKIRSLKLEISIEEAKITRQKPRDTAVRVIGLEDNSAILYLRRELVHAESELDTVEAELRMFEFRRDVFRAISYKERV